MSQTIWPQDSAQRMRVDEALVHKGMLKPADLAKALELQACTGERIGRILIALGLVRRQQLYETLADLWERPLVDLLKTPINRALAHRFDPQVFVRHRFMPIVRHEDVVDVATAQYPTEALTRTIQEVLGAVTVNYLVTTEWDVDQPCVPYSAKSCSIVPCMGFTIGTHASVPTRSCPPGSFGPWWASRWG